MKKGEIYERNLFTAKNKLFKQENFMDEVKHFYTDLVNLLIEDEKEKLHVFDSNGLYLATKKIGKNNPKAEQIQTDNGYRMRWNREVDRAIVSGVEETEIRQIKQEYITDRIKESVDLFGNKPERYGNIIMDAVIALALLISKILEKAREMSARLFDTELIQPQTPKQEPAVSSPKESQTESKILPKPVMSAEATAYPKLLKIYKELNRQNGIIFDAERERNNLEIERDSLKGLAKLTKKGELQSRIDRKNEEIDLLKTGLSGIVKRYGFQNVQEFYRVYQKAKNAYADYRENTNKWENTYGEKAASKQKSIHERLQNYQKEILGQSTERNIQQKEKGAR